MYLCNMYEREDTQMLDVWVFCEAMLCVHNLGNITWGWGLGVSGRLACRMLELTGISAQPPGTGPEAHPPQSRTFRLRTYLLWHLD